MKHVINSKSRSTENNDSEILLNPKVTWPAHRYWSVSDTQHILVITLEFSRSPTLSRESRGGGGWGHRPNLFFRPKSSPVRAEAPRSGREIWASVGDVAPDVVVWSLCVYSHGWLGIGNGSVGLPSREPRVLLYAHLPQGEFVK